MSWWPLAQGVGQQPLVEAKQLGVEQQVEGAQLLNGRQEKWHQSACRAVSGSRNLLGVLRLEPPLEALSNCSRRAFCSRNSCI